MDVQVHHYTADGEIPLTPRDLFLKQIQSPGDEQDVFKRACHMGYRSPQSGKVTPNQCRINNDVLAETCYHLTGIRPLRKWVRGHRVVWVCNREWVWFQEWGYRTPSWSLRNSSFQGAVLHLTGQLI